MLRPVHKSATRNAPALLIARFQSAPLDLIPLPYVIRLDSIFMHVLESKGKLAFSLLNASNFFLLNNNAFKLLT